MNWRDSTERRLAYLSAIQTTNQAALERERCRRDPVHWINTWVWTYDPRAPLTRMPFDLFPRQAELIRWLQERETTKTDGLIEKSREVGATWLCAAYQLHGWIFREGFAGGFGSNKLEKVDR